MSGTVVELVQKMAAIEATLKACASGECQPQDVAVVAYVASAINRETGELRQHYKTMAAGCGMSRSSLVRALKRVVDAGIITRCARHARNGAQISTSFGITPRTISEPPPNHRRSTWLSRCIQYPDGGPVENDKSDAKRGQTPAAAIDWGEVEDWLWDQVGYRRLYSDASRSDASIDLNHLRANIGDQALAAAIGRAKWAKLYGKHLLDFLENTRPANDVRRSATRTTAQ